MTLLIGVNEEWGQYCLFLSILFSIWNKINKIKINEDEINKSMILLFAVNGEWGSWSTDGLCSSSCGAGEMTFKRECDSPAPDCQGEECEGQSLQALPCDAGCCPGEIWEKRGVKIESGCWYHLLWQVMSTYHCSGVLSVFIIL